MAQGKIIVVDDEAKVREYFSEFLTHEGFEVFTAQNGEVALKMMDEEFFDIALIDLNMPKVDGMTVLKYLKENSPDSIGIILTGHATIKNAVEAMKTGAYDYLAKPVKMEEVLMVIERAQEYLELKRENFVLKNQLKKKYRFENFIGDSLQMNKVFRLTLVLFSIAQ